ncbi:MAG: DUF4190 domain-containing protein [Acidimicrobiales bacterium]
MFCENCRNQLSDQAQFCPSCGNPSGSGAPFDPRSTQPSSAGFSPAGSPLYNYQPQLPVATPGRTNGLAIASLVLGILWIVGLGAVAALILGIVGKNQIDRSNGEQTGRGLAIAGIVLGAIGIIGAIIFIVILVAFGHAVSNNQY